MNSSKQIKVKRLDLSDIPNDSVCVFIGKRKSGKSCAIRDLMYHKKNIPIGQIISGSEKANPFFHNFFPSSYIEEEYTVDTLDNIFKRQCKIREFAKKQKALNKREIDTRFLIVFDDCLHDTKWQKAKQIKNIFMNGRHFGIFFILSMQYVIGIPPNLRTNIDYVFIFRDYSIQNRKKLYENFGGSIPSFALFCSLMDHLDKFECLVICTDADKVKFQDQVMYFKAKLRKNFKFGSDIMWEQDKKIKLLKNKYTESHPYHPNYNLYESFGNNSQKKQIKIMKVHNT